MEVDSSINITAAVLSIVHMIYFTILRCAVWNAPAYKQVVDSPHTATWPLAGFYGEAVDAEYHCAKENKLDHDIYDDGEGLAACALSPRLNRYDVGRGKLWTN